MTLLDTLKALRLRPTQRTARFVLLYKSPTGKTVTVGHLEFDSLAWTFRYDEEYKARPDLRPIEGFDDLQKVYQSSILFPFFAVRIPDEHRTDVKKRLAEERMTDP